MANHVHVLLCPKISPSRLLQSLKGFTAREANRMLGRTGEPFWQAESNHHWVRDEREYLRIADYIECNPVKAGLVECKPGPAHRHDCRGGRHACPRHSGQSAKRPKLTLIGKGPSLSYRLRFEVVEAVCAQVGGRVPVLVGISDTSFVGSVGVANHAARSGAAAAVLAAPYYFLSSKDDLLRYVKRIALDISLPLFLYNIPSLTKVFVFTAVPDYDASLWQNHFSLNGETAPITGGGPGLDTKGQTPQ